MLLAAALPVINPGKNASEFIDDWITTFDNEKVEDCIPAGIPNRKILPKGLDENIKVARIGGNVAKVATEQLEENLGETIVTSNNKLNYEYIDETKELIGE